MSSNQLHNQRVPRGEYIPTIFDNYIANPIVDKKLLRVALLDTAGTAAYDLLRPLSYPQTSIIILCFSVVSKNPLELESVKSKWVPEIRKHMPGNNTNNVTRHFQYFHVTLHFHVTPHASM